MGRLDLDALARSVGRTTSRRQALRLLVSGAAVAGAAAVVRPTSPGPRAVALTAFTCSTTNTVSTACTDLNAYVAQCGVLCPSVGGAPAERLVGKGGCTVANGGATLADYTPTVTKKSATRFCATATVNGTFTAHPKSTVLSWSPSTPSCCQSVCTNEVADVLAALTKHEAGHRSIINKAVAAATTAWTDKTETACAPTAAKARTALGNKVTADFTAQVADLEQQFLQEPPQARPVDCGKCIPRTTMNRCCNGVCTNGSCGTIWCNCNKTCYADAGTCTSNCHASLGCFTGICEPAPTCPPPGA